MKIMSKFFGELNIDVSKITTFEEGLLGFEDCRQFVLLPHPKDAMFCWLQSVEKPQVCFLMADPAQFMFNYQIEVSDAVVEKLKLTRPDTVATYTLVVVPEDHLKISANLAGPLVINTETRLGAQVISMDKAHRIRHYIIEELKANASFLVSNFMKAVSGVASLEVNVAVESQSSLCEEQVAENTASILAACGL